MDYSECDKGTSSIISTLLILAIIIIVFTLIFSYINLDKCSDVYADTQIEENGNVNIIDQGNVDYFLIQSYNSEIVVDDASINIEAINGDDLLNRGLENVLNKQIKNKQDALKDIRVTSDGEVKGILEDTNDEIILNKNNLSGEIILKNEEMKNLFPKGINNVLNKNIENMENTSQFKINLGGGDEFRIKEEDNLQIDGDTISVIGISDGCEKLLNKKEF